MKPVTNTKIISITVSNAAKIKVTFHVNNDAKYSVINTANNAPQTSNKTKENKGTGSYMNKKKTIKNNTVGNTPRYHLEFLSALNCSYKTVPKAHAAKPTAAKPPKN